MVLPVLGVQYVVVRFDQLPPIRLEVDLGLWMRYRHVNVVDSDLAAVDTADGRLT